MTEISDAVRDFVHWFASSMRSGGSELVAALVGALVGGFFSAIQTSLTLKNERRLAAAERLDAKQEEEDRRVVGAAGDLLAALADYSSAFSKDGARPRVLFMAVPGLEEEVADRSRRMQILTAAGARSSHLLPATVRGRWDALIWLARYCHEGRFGDKRKALGRHYADLVTYTEYVRRTLAALTLSEPLPPSYLPPDPRREGPTPWGHDPERTDEPNMLEWYRNTRAAGLVEYARGRFRWHGPDGVVEEVPAPDTQGSDSGG